MQFRKYEKIYRLGKEETDGILIGSVNVTEKLDGANLSIWMDNDVLHVGSRNNDLTLNGNLFNGAVEYCNAHPGIRKALQENPTYRLYGEWLVRHTLAYNETAYKKFYLFDVLSEPEGTNYMIQSGVQEFGERYGIETVPNLGEFINPTLKDLTKLVEGQKSVYGEKREGIVLRNPEFVNTFGDKCNAKIVSEGFMEDNGITFGGNNKYSEVYWEQFVSNKYITLERVQKIMQKIQPEINKRLDMEHIPRIINTVYHDMIQEEGWEIANKVKKLDYDVLKRICSKKAKQVYVDILNGQISVADQQLNETCPYCEAELSLYMAMNVYERHYSGRCQDNDNT